MSSEFLKNALVPENERPYSLPNGWLWVRLGSVGEYRKGPFGSSITKSMFVDRAENTFKIYEQGNAIRKDVNYGHYYINEEKYLELEAFSVIANDIIVSCAGTIGEIFSLPQNIEKGIINQALMRIRVTPCVEKDFYVSVFDSILKERMSLESIGTAIKNIPPLKVLKNFAFPLPPLPEQKRIVDKLDSLLDKIKEARTLINEAKESFANRRSAILHKAFTGELTANWRAENQTEDAKELLEQINIEKLNKYNEDCLIAQKAGKTKPKKPEIMPVEDMLVRESEQPYKLPNSWVWVRLGNVVEKLTDGSHFSPETTYDGYPYVTVRDLRDGIIDLINCKKISQKDFNLLKSGNCSPKFGDVLFSKDGTVGKTAVVNFQIDFVVLSSLAIITPYQNVTHSFFLEKALNSPQILDIALGLKTGTAIRRVVLKSLTNLQIPLPPLSEQKEIVRRVDDLLKAETEAKELLEMDEQIDLIEKAVLSKAFRGELGTQDASDEPAMELLKRLGGEVGTKKSKGYK